MYMLKHLGTFGVTKEKMFTFSRVWKGVRLHLKALIVLCYGRLSSVPSRAKILHNLIVYLLKLEKNHGSLVAVKWLKANHVALQKYLGGDKLPSLRDLEPDIPLPRLYNGLPAIINRRDRRRIQQGELKTIQFWLSSFSLYRVLKSEFVPKLKTITGEYTGDKSYSWEFLDYIDSSPRGNFFSRLRGYDQWYDKINLAPKNVSFIRSSSPSQLISWRGLLTDALYLSRSDLFKYFNNYCSLVRANNFLRMFKEALSLALRLSESGVALAQKCTMVSPFGQLAFKEEAAGKLRVFALVDVWTQSLLKPLHEELFRLLRLIPNDGTFDQDESVRRSAKKAEISGCAYSFDLSAATDRLPIIFQSALLDRILPVKVGNNWAGLLVMRDYYLPKSKEKYGIETEKVRYTVGQPMGALSSWAMLALTHHYLLQFCASQTRKTMGWYENYEILGDDLVIFDAEVADFYLDLMTKLGVEINLSKSIVASKKPVFEFAKRTVVAGVNVSGISVKQLISGTSMGSRIANILYFANLGLIRTNTVLSILLSRYYKTDNKSALWLPSLALLGSLFGQKRVSLKGLMTVLIDPKDEEFDFNESEFSLPLVSILTAQKELLNDKSLTISELKLSDMETRLEIWDEIEGDVVASVLLKALQRIKDLENSFYELTESGKYAEMLVADFERFKSSNPLEVSQLDGWVTERIINYDKFDLFELVEEVEAIAMKHAKYPSVTLDKALSVLDMVESWWLRFDIVKQKRVSTVDTMSPAFTWLAQSQGTGRTGYLQDRKWIY